MLATEPFVSWAHIHPAVPEFPLATSAERPPPAAASRIISFVAWPRALWESDKDDFTKRDENEFRLHVISFFRRVLSRSSQGPR